jgi:hypothetical protein
MPIIRFNSSNLHLTCGDTKQMNRSKRVPLICLFVGDVESAWALPTRGGWLVSEAGAEEVDFTAEGGELLSPDTSCVQNKPASVQGV